MCLADVGVCCNAAAWVGLMTCSKAGAAWTRLLRHALAVMSHRQAPDARDYNARGEAGWMDRMHTTQRQ